LACGYWLRPPDGSEQANPRLNGRGTPGAFMPLLTGSCAPKRRAGSIVTDGAPMTDISTLDTATRIAAADDGTWYDPVAITLHWTTAVLVVLQMALAQT